LYTRCDRDYKVWYIIDQEVSYAWVGRDHPPIDDERICVFRGSNIQCDDPVIYEVVKTIRGGWFNGRQQTIRVSTAIANSCVVDMVGNAIDQTLIGSIIDKYRHLSIVNVPSDQMGELIANSVLYARDYCRKLGHDQRFGDYWWSPSDFHHGL